LLVAHNEDDSSFNACILLLLPTEALNLTLGTKAFSFLKRRHGKIGKTGLKSFSAVLQSFRIQHLRHLVHQKWR
jgi:hypothetical protein